MNDDWSDWWEIYRPVVIACSLALVATIGLAIFTWWCGCGPARLMQ